MDGWLRQHRAPHAAAAHGVATSCAALLDTVVHAHRNGAVGDGGSLNDADGFGLTFRSETSGVLERAILTGDEDTIGDATS